ncbi:DNA-3-methyladenine glycosylase I [Candidatus Cytomitobacter indipagum]|uniref:DNA-3-methyladenine glycosylase I n=1 Tax=Candidatus Cytomitobacter indipagum TaxID=2601575 RepID=A0A5C0UE89_9PROT|nr:DNA-3-methyladenine glycosylase I [Candidatus Cytomitobacter indipagum]QEK38020.1 DNA-3-methyladenine glycosylase I [Candidatus Cytomitobacter indipagum]
MERCFGSNSKIYSDYHDFEWGVPLHDDRDLFELLILEGAHAGLSWEIILNKRENYRKAFHNFDINLVANMTDNQLDELLLDKGIVRNRLKVYSARKNAKIFIEIQKEFGSFDKYIWKFFNFKTIKNAWKDFENVPVSNEESDKISKDLKKRGMSFVGSKIIYAYMQSAGMVNDHVIGCPQWKKIDQKIS